MGNGVTFSMFIVKYEVGYPKLHRPINTSVHGKNYGSPGDGSIRHRPTHTNQGMNFEFFLAGKLIWMWIWEIFKNFYYIYHFRPFSHWIWRFIGEKFPFENHVKLSKKRRSRVDAAFRSEIPVPRLISLTGYFSPVLTHFRAVTLRQMAFYSSLCTQFCSNLRITPGKLSSWDIQSFVKGIIHLLDRSSPRVFLLTEYAHA